MRSTTAYGTDLRWAERQERRFAILAGPGPQPPAACPLSIRQLPCDLASADCNLQGNAPNLPAAAVGEFFMTVPVKIPRSDSRANSKALCRFAAAAIPAGPTFSRTFNSIDEFGAARLTPPRLSLALGGPDSAAPHGDPPRLSGRGADICRRPTRDPLLPVLVLQRSICFLSGLTGPPRPFEPSPSPILQGVQQVVVIGLVLYSRRDPRGKPNKF